MGARRHRNWVRGSIAAFCGLLLLVACVSDAVSSPREQAERFVRALNADDVGRLVAVSESPFLLREQAWESASDGYGFVLGAVSEENYANREQMFRDLVARVAVDSEETVGLRAYETLTRELRGASLEWQRLDLFVFLRGEADVEHIAVVGVSRQTGKVTALYLN